MKVFSVIKRVTLAETMAVLLFLTLEALAYGGTQLLRHVDPGAGDEILINIAYFWQLMAISGVSVALVLGGPSYLLCSGSMTSRRLPLWISGAIVVIGGLMLFAVLLDTVLHSGCG